MQTHAFGKYCYLFRCRNLYSNSLTQLNTFWSVALKTVNGTVSFTAMIVIYLYVNNAEMNTRRVLIRRTTKWSLINNAKDNSQRKNVNTIKLELLIYFAKIVICQDVRNARYKITKGMYCSIWRCYIRKKFSCVFQKSPRLINILYPQRRINKIR